MAKAVPSSKNLHFDVILYPHRSLKPEHCSKLILGLIILCTLASVRFIAVGAWPVTIFLGLDIAALWFAFYLNYRRARMCETIKLDSHTLEVERRVTDGSVERWSFEPYWVHAQLKDDDYVENQLLLSHHRQQVSLGQFLTPGERRDLYFALSSALRQWKSRPAPGSSAATSLPDNKPV